MAARYHEVLLGALSLKIDLLSPKRDLCEKLIDMSMELGELCYVTFGLRSCAKGKGQGGKDRLITSSRSENSAKPYLEGRDIKRYTIHWPGKYIRYIPEEMYSPRSPALFDTRKLVSQTMLSRMRLVATLDDVGYYVEQSLLCIIPHGILTDSVPTAEYPLEFLLGVINSRLESFYFASYIIDYSLGGGLVHATPGTQAKLLIPKDSSAFLDRITDTTKHLLSLQKSRTKSQSAHDKTIIQREIDHTDREIDRLVYELYGLTDEEIQMIEEATS